MRTERSRAVNLAVLLVVLAALASLLEGPAVWLGALIVGAAAAFGAFALLAEVGGGRLRLGATLLLEARLMGPADDARARRGRQLVPVVVLLAFLGFASVAGAIYAGLAAPLPGTTEPAAIDQGSLLLLAFARGGGA